MSGEPDRRPEMPARSSAQILESVRAIPAGFVRTYGDLSPGAPRHAGRALRGTSERVPWWRVVRADGSLPLGEAQRSRLYAEGVPWSWAINGITSVLGSVLGVAIAITSGFEVATLVACGCYIAALTHVLIGRWPVAEVPGAPWSSSGRELDHGRARQDHDRDLGRHAEAGRAVSE